MYLQYPETPVWLRPTYCVCFTEASGDHIVHVAVFTELELRQVHLHLAVLYKHTLFHHLEEKIHKGVFTTIHVILWWIHDRLHVCRLLCLFFLSLILKNISVVLSMWLNLYSIDKSSATVYYLDTCSLDENLASAYHDTIMSFSAFTDTYISQRI